MTFIAILGRQPALSIAELEQVFGSDNIVAFSATAATVDSDSLDVQRLGGTTKAGRIVMRFKATTWQEASRKITMHYVDKWSGIDRKQTLGISVYDWLVSKRDVQMLGLGLKSSLKKHSVSLRIIPNQDTALNSAVSHHNKLGLSDNKTELLIARGPRGDVFVAESVGAQNITALARRDQGRPKRDAFVGMLPPKLALMMVNLSGVKNGRVLDPFCGTGVILQEALLLGLDAYGTDLLQKMIDYSTINLDWLKETHHVDGDFTLHHGDAIETLWQQPIAAVVAETYLGQPFSAPPSADKLQKVVTICDAVITSFLENLAPQLDTGTPLCLAVPAWRDASGHQTHLGVTRKLGDLGYVRATLRNVRDEDLLYYREDQVVARELLILRKR